MTHALGSPLLRQCGFEGCELNTPQVDKNVKLLRCSRCKEVRYCGTAHQRLAWPEHKKVCVLKDSNSRDERPVTTSHSEFEKLRELINNFNAKREKRVLEEPQRRCILQSLTTYKNLYDKVTKEDLVHQLQTALCSFSEYQPNLVKQVRTCTTKLEKTLSELHLKLGQFSKDKSLAEQLDACQQLNSLSLEIAKNAESAHILLSLLFSDDFKV